jgi:translation initiation factor IF-2
MPKKVFELAAELGLGAIDLVEKVKSFGMNVRNHMATLSDEEVNKVLSLLGEEKKKQGSPAKKVVKRSVSSDPKTKTTPSAQKAATGKVASKTAKPVSDSVSHKDDEAKDPLKKKSIIRRKVQDHSLQDKDDSLHEEEHEEFVAHSLQDEREFEEEAHSLHAQTSHDDEQVEMIHNETMDEEISEVSSVGPDDGEGTSDMSKNSVVDSQQEQTDQFPGKKKEDYPELRGLQVVFRPPARPEPVAKASVEAPPVQETPATSPTSSGREGPQKKKVYLDEKMHSFTPIYIPPKKAVEKTVAKSLSSQGDAKGKEEAAPKFRQVSTVAKTTSSNLSPFASKGFPKMDGEEEGRKRMGGLAAMMAKPKSKVRDIEQIRADEELKTYNVGVVGKAVYTPPGRKKVYSGAKKETLITAAKESKRFIGVHYGLYAEELSQKLNIKFDELRDRCLEIDLLVKPRDYLGLKLLENIVGLFQFKIKNLAFDENKVIKSQKRPQEGDSIIRPPVVTIMGHVDHGKTSLLDYIRRTKVAAGEAGGITQHLGAYTVQCNGQDITFIDTPGHAAFSSMRERGANVTDIVVLVVAADDGVMPQTRESVQICQSLNVPIIVAINKMDKEGANPERIKQSLLNFQLTAEEWGGETQYVPISALTGMGVDQLLESILVQAEVMDLQATTKGSAEGIVLESHLEMGRGPIVTVLVKSGQLKTGDVVVVGEQYGRARSLSDTLGKVIKSVLPSYSAQILGLDGTPKPGDKFHVVQSEREAKKIIDNRVLERKEALQRPIKKKVALEDFFSTQKDEQGKKVLRLILRTDVSGSFEALKSALEKMGNDEVGVEMVAGGTGAITDNDIQLADSIKGIVIGFNMRPVTSAQRLAEEKGIDVKTYRIIYELLDEVKLALEGLLEPDKVEKYIGRAEVRNIFTVPKVGTIAGSAVIDGKIERGCSIRLLRDGKIVHDGKISTLKRFKDDVKEVKSGYECGIALDSYNLVQINDIFEAYIMEQKKRSLEEKEPAQKMF